MSGQTWAAEVVGLLLSVAATILHFGWKRRPRVTWQNLNERPNGSGWREGRAWLWWPRKDRGGSEQRLHCEWSHFKRPRLACVLQINHGEPGWLFHVSFLIGTWYVGDGEYGFTARRFGVEIIDGDWVRVFVGKRDADGRAPASGWELSIHVLDLLLGRQRYSEGTSDTAVRVLIPMPERAYAATITMRNDRWKRPRWVARYMRRAEVEFDKGEQLPVPGKGENAWDCGQDAIYGMMTPARDVAEAIGKVVESAMRTRIQHGGVNWAPTPETAQ